MLDKLADNYKLNVNEQHPIVSVDSSNSNLSFLDKKFNLIYCDPPWSYHLYRPQYSHKYDPKVPIRTAASFYNTMSLKKICSLPVEKIAQTTVPYIPDNKLPYKVGFHVSGCPSVLVQVTATFTGILGYPVIEIQVDRPFSGA